MPFTPSGEVAFLDGQDLCCMPIFATASEAVWKSELVNSPPRGYLLGILVMEPGLSTFPLLCHEDIISEWQDNNHEKGGRQLLNA